MGIRDYEYYGITIHILKLYAGLPRKNQWHEDRVSLMHNRSTNLESLVFVVQSNESLNIATEGELIATVGSPYWKLIPGLILRLASRTFSYDKSTTLDNLVKVTAVFR